MTVRLVIPDGNFVVSLEDKFTNKAFTNPVGCNVIVPPSAWEPDFWMGIIQSGTGKVIVQAANGVEIAQRQNDTGTAGLGAFVAVMADPSQQGLFWLVGDTG